MISAVLLLLLSAGRAFGADVYPAANAGYVRDAMFARTRCKLSNQAPDGAAINMEYLMRVVDLCNHNMTQYGASVYATRHMANTRAVQWATDMTYVTDGLILILDATHMDDWFTHGPVTVLPDGVKIDGAFVRTRDMINLATYQNVTVEVRFKPWYDEQMLFYEHSSDWNKEICGFGTVFNVGTTRGWIIAVLLERFQHARINKMAGKNRPILI